MPAPVLTWSNVGVDVQTALATAIPLSGITKASPAVATYTGATNPTLGDYILLSASGVSQLDNRVFRIANVNTTTKTFELEGENSTGYDTFSSGSFQVITFGASMRTAQTVSFNGGGLKMVDITTIHDAMEKKSPAAINALDVSMDNLFDVTDPAIVELSKAFKERTQRVVRFRFPSGAKFLCTGLGGSALIPAGQAQGVVQTKVELSVQSMPTTYAT